VWSVRTYIAGSEFSYFNDTRDTSDSSDDALLFEDSFNLVELAFDVLEPLIHVVLQVVSKPLHLTDGNVLLV
jgi:hypothetical protein